MRHRDRSLKTRWGLFCDVAVHTEWQLVAEDGREKCMRLWLVGLVGWLVGRLVVCLFVWLVGCLFG